jgi:hypothetical protein
MATSSYNSNKKFIEEKGTTFHQRHPHPIPRMTTVTYFIPSVHCQRMSENGPKIRRKIVSLDKNMDTITQTTNEANDCNVSKETC